MALDEPKDNEQPVHVNGIDFLVAEGAEPWVDGATVDYIKNWYKEGFTISGGSGDC